MNQNLKEIPPGQRIVDFVEKEAAPQIANRFTGSSELKQKFEHALAGVLKNACARKDYLIYMYFYLDEAIDYLLEEVISDMQVDENQVIDNLDEFLVKVDFISFSVQII